MKKIVGILLICFACMQMQSQHYCATDKVFESLAVDENTFESYQRRIAGLAEKSRVQNRDQVYIIPVVFHILHRGGVENIPDEQVYDQMRIINEDFRKLNESINNVIPEFQGVAADCEIEFRLAKLDPEGNCTNGIIRHYEERTYATDLHDADSLKMGRQWPRERYLNIYVLGSIETSGGGTTLGFAYYPVTVDTAKIYRDGIMQVYTSVGSFGTSSERLSGVLTHEIGHYLHLHHTWGQGTAGSNESCNEDDEVADTPNTKGNPSVCVLAQESCGSLDNVQNFMDYSFCYAMLTAGQRDRMHVVLNDTIADRNNLWQTENLIATGTNEEYAGVLCEAGFLITNRHTCVNVPALVEDKSYHNIQNRYWESAGALTPLIFDSAVASFTYTNPGIYDVQLAVTGNNDSLNVVQENGIFVHANPGVSLPDSQQFTNAIDFNNLLWDTAGYTGTGFQFANVGKDDNRSIFVDNINAISGSVHTFQTTTYDGSNTTDNQVVFDVAYAPKGSVNNDKLKVFINTGACDEEWILLETFEYFHIIVAASQSDPFVPTNSQWREKIVNIPDSLASATMRFKVEFVSGKGNNVYLDNFTVRQNPNVSLLELSKAKGVWVTKNAHWEFLVGTQISQVAVHHIDGRLIGKYQNKRSLSHANLAAGVYVISWQTGGNRFTQRVIKP